MEQASRQAAPWGGERLLFVPSWSHGPNPLVFTMGFALWPAVGRCRRSRHRGRMSRSGRDHSRHSVVVNLGLVSAPPLFAQQRHEDALSESLRRHLIAAPAQSCQFLKAGPPNGNH